MPKSTTLLLQLTLISILPYLLGKLNQEVFQARSTKELHPVKQQPVKAVAATNIETPGLTIEKLDNVDTHGILQSYQVAQHVRI